MPFAELFRWGVAAAALGLAALGLLLWADGGSPLGATLLWGMPLLALLATLGGDALWRERRRWLLLATSAASVAWLIDHLAAGPRPFAEGLLLALVVGATVAGTLMLARDARAAERLRALRREVTARPWRGLFALWALLMIPAPLFPEHFPIFAYASTSALTLGVLALSRRRFGGARTLLLFVAAFTFGVAVEVVGERTGFPFGSYAYRAVAPSLFGVPLLVPLGWYALTLIAIAVAPRTPLGTRLFAPLALVVWDLGLDPLMVLKGFWAFEVGPYFGVPWSNFLGWLGAGGLLVALLVRLEPRLLVDELPDLRHIYLAQAFLIGVGLAFFGLPLAGLIAGMLMLAVFGWGARAAPRGR
jgi:putative membrane protein